MKLTLSSSVAKKIIFSGWKSLIEAFKIMPGTISSCVQVINDGYLLSISPGGVREAMFSDHNYPLLWGSRCGFAKVAIEAQCVSFTN